MTDAELEAVEIWQQSLPGQADHNVWLLERTVDDLTDLVKTRDGSREIVAQSEAIRRAMRKLADLQIEIAEVA